MENTQSIDSELKAYQAPEAELLDHNNVKQSATFFPVSLTKLKVMFLVTLGLYSVVWFYQNWKLQQKHMEKKIRPVWRAIFSIFFTHSLFERIHKKTSELGMENWSAQGLATLFVVFTILGNLSDRVFEKIDSLAQFAPLGILLILLPLISLIQVQKRVNLINDDPEGRMNSNFSAINILFIVLGVVWWVAVLFGLFIIMTEQPTA